MFLLLVFVPAIVARAFEPMTFFREQFISSNFFAAFVPPSSTQWVRVEFSTDLTNWIERANAIATRARLFTEAGAKGVPRGFYRLAAPGTELDDARRRWEALGIHDYRFRFSTVPTGPVAPTGVLTVSGGQKTLSEVRDTITGEPLENIDSSEIPDIGSCFRSFLSGPLGRRSIAAWPMTRKNVSLERPPSC